MKYQPTKQLQSFDDVLRVLEAENAVLHAPSYPPFDRTEITYLNETDVEYECPAAMYTAILKALNVIDLEEFKGYRMFKHVYLQEPGCGGGWAIIASSNYEALLYQVEPPKTVPIDPDEVDDE